MSFEKLLADLGEMKKSMPAVGADQDTKPEGDGAVGANGDDGKGEAPLAKSFTFVLSDGSTVEAADGSVLVKALIDRQSKSDETTQAAIAQIGEVVTAQTALIKSLQEQVGAMAGTGRGRKSTVSMPAADDGDLRKADAGMTGPQFMAKCEQAWHAGKVTGREMQQCETLLNKGMQIPASIAEKVLG